ncbi:MAG: gamma-glutamyltransferase [Chloroflexia bacterium]|nr:gamma-glutamyltransferase [Chloroflexia bacterium]
MRSLRPTTIAPTAMIATPHHLATSTGLEILRDGGSAMDAVIAANTVLTVLYPDQTAIGGDCFFIVWDAADESAIAFNGSGAAAMTADPEALRAQGFAAMPRRGPFTVLVPGTIDAWVEGHERFGTLPFDRLLGPAIRYARDGFPVSPRLASVLVAEQETIAGLPGLAALIFPRGTPPTAGERLRLPALAGSLELIASEGRDAFYTGEIAAAIEQTIRDLGGWLTIEDLASHHGEWVEPLTAPYRDIALLTVPPNSQGLTALLALQLVDRVDLGERWGGGEHLHPLIEAKKLAFSVRDATLSDPRFVDIDTRTLLSRATVDRLWRAYDPERAGTGQASLPGDTVYLCAVDRDGNAVSLIQSIFQSFGSGVVAGDTGIILQNRGSSFSLTPGHPNELAPGKRTLHTLMPSMLTRDGRLLGPLGTQGGDAQVPVQMQLITHLIDFGMDPQPAIDAPRWLAAGPSAASPNSVLLEAGFPEATLPALANRGHEITVIEPWNPNAGHAQLILVDHQTGMLRGGADPRADGTAAGY